MANLDLEQTVLWDLKEAVRICGEVISWVGCPEIISWRFPALKAVCVDSLREYDEYSEDKNRLTSHHSAAKQRYLFLLELIYDRIIMFLELICIFLENLPSSIPHQESQPFQRRNHVPKSHLNKLKGSFGLAEPLSELWNRLLGLRGFVLQHLTQMVRKNEECNTLIGSTKTSKMYRTSETQYQSLEVKEENSLQSCDCCFFTRSVIKDITKCLSEIPDYKTGPDGPETSPGNYSILAREKVRSELFFLSDWGAVSKLLTAAVEDVYNMVKRYKFLAANHSELMLKIHHSDSNHEKDIKRLQSDYKEQISKLKHELENANLQKQETEEKLNEVQNQLESEKIQNSKIENQFKSKEESYLTTTKAFQELEKEAKIRETSLNASLETLQKTLEKERERANRMEAQQLNSELIHLKITEELKESLIEAQTKGELWMKYLAQVEQRKNIQVETDPGLIQCSKELKIELSKLRGKHCSLLGEFNENRCTIKRLEKQLRESQDREAVLLEYPDINGPIEFKVKGDPLSDMDGQIKANELRIKMLIDQNKRMDRTITKLRNLSNKN